MLFAICRERLRGPKATLATAVLALLAASSIGVAQTAPAPGQPPWQPSGPSTIQLKSAPAQPDWTKVCSKDATNNADVCYTTRDFVSDLGQQLMAVALYESRGGPQVQRVIRVVVPLGLLLIPGVRFTVDEGQPAPGRFGLCLANGCFAEAVVKDDFVAAMKNGANLSVSVQNQAARDIVFVAPLAGFGKAFDGPPMDPGVLAEHQKKIQEELQRRSEALRQRLEQGAAPAAPGAAPGAAPAAPAGAPKPQ